MRHDIYNNTSSGAGNLSSEYRNYESLWRAVLMQVLTDYKSQHKRSSSKVAQYHAKNWLDMNNEEFNIVCSLANINIQNDIDSIKCNLNKYAKLLKKRNFADRNN